MPEPQGSEECRSTWWERRPGWQRGLLIVVIAALIVAVAYLITQA
jgi:hypothetical protein